MKYTYHGFYRFWLAIFVLISHYFLYFFPETPIIGELQLGNVAVASFFVLSGYLMNEAFINFYHDKPLNFITNRYLRITPLFFLAGVLSVTLHSFIFTLYGGTEIPDVSISEIHTDSAFLSILGSIFPFNTILIKIWSLFSDNISHTYEFVRFSWAIFTELIFYWCIFFFHVFKNRSPIASRIFTLLIICVICAAILKVHYGLSVPILWGQHFQWGGHFLFGLFTSELLTKKDKGLVYKLYILGAMLLAFMQFYLYASKSTDTAIFALTLYTLCQVIFYLIVAQHKNFWGMSETRDQQWGNYSYPIYINQFGLSVLFIGIMETYFNGLDDYSIPIRSFFFIIYVTYILVSCHWLERCSDFLTTNLRNKIRGRAI